MDPLDFHGVATASLSAFGQHEVFLETWIFDPRNSRTCLVFISSTFVFFFTCGFLSAPSVHHGATLSLHSIYRLCAVVRLRSRCGCMRPGRRCGVGIQPPKPSETLGDYAEGGLESLSLVDKRASLFGNARCSSNFRELARARWPQQRVSQYSAITSLGLTAYHVWYGRT